jgi:hypothetical protein
MLKSGPPGCRTLHAKGANLGSHPELGARIFGCRSRVRTWPVRVQSPLPFQLGEAAPENSMAGSRIRISAFTVRRPNQLADHGAWSPGQESNPLPAPYKGAARPHVLPGPIWSVWQDSNLRFPFGTCSQDRWSAGLTHTQKNKKPRLCGPGLAEKQKQQHLTRLGFLCGCRLLMRSRHGIKYNKNRHAAHKKKPEAA